MIKYKAKHIKSAMALRRAMSSKKKKMMTKRRPPIKNTKKTMPEPVPIIDKSPMILPLTLYEKCIKINDTNLELYYLLLGIDGTKSVIESRINRLSEKYQGDYSINIVPKNSRIRQL